MSEETVTLPKLGESIVSATVVQWFKKEGDQIERDEPLLEVSTDKVNSEIPSPVAGTLSKIIAQVDEEIDVGAPLATITTGEAASTKTKTPQTEAPAEMQSSDQSQRDVYSPSVLRLAKEKGISFDALGKIQGTGEGGRITKKDLENYSAGEAVCTKEIERVKMSGLRKAIADNLVRSFYEAPHATLVCEIDVSNVKEHIAKEKDQFLAQHGAKLTITSMVVQAIAKALQKYPHLNSSLEDDTIVVKHFCNLGIAVSVEQGIVVPVIKNCQALSLADIAKEVQGFAEKARSNSLTPGDTLEGTITLTNFGMSGIEIGIPIIRFPEVAIIGIGAIHKKAVVLKDDTIAPRSMMNLSLTFDHRVIDGMYGCNFLSHLKQLLEA